MHKTLLATFLLLLGAPAFGSEPSHVAPDSTYTLYRSSATAGGANMRVHVATFDATDGSTYNRDNCEIAKNLFQGQPGVTVTYWCERGNFSKKTK